MGKRAVCGVIVQDVNFIPEEDKGRGCLAGQSGYCSFRNPGSPGPPREDQGMIITVEKAEGRIAARVEGGTKPGTVAFDAHIYGVQNSGLGIAGENNDQGAESGEKQKIEPRTNCS